MNDENRLLLPKVDFLFKKIFGEEKNKELLKDFLASILGLQKEKMTGLTLTNNELLKDYSEDRKGTLDVRVEMDDEDEERKKVEIDVEIQLKTHRSMKERILFYWSKMFVQPFEEGMSFSQLRKTVSIIIFDETLLPLEKYHSRFHIWEDSERLLFSDALEIHIIELQKAMKVIGTKPANDELSNWLLFLSNDKLEVCEMLSTQSAVFNRAVQEQKSLSQNRDVRAYYDRRLVEMGDEVTKLREARHEGINIGRSEGISLGRNEGISLGRNEGISLGKLETARRMLGMGLNLETISQATGLTEAQLRLEA